MRDRHPLYLTLLWLAVVLAVDPRGDFPLNDDWSYGKAVHTLVAEGRFELTDFTSMPLVAQVGWGGLWCGLLGFSFTVLRISTLVLAWMGLQALYRMLRDLGVAGSQALLGVLVLAFNPLFLSLSFTFMTDVPFASLSMVGLWLFTRSRLREGARERSLYLVAATVVAVLATLVRQLGIFLPLVYGAGVLLQGRLRPVKVLVAILPLGAVVAALWGYLALLQAMGGMPSMMEGGFAVRDHASLGAWWKYMTGHARWGMDYLGLFLAPLWLWNGQSWWNLLLQTIRRANGGGAGVPRDHKLRTWGLGLGLAAVAGYFMVTSLIRLFKLHGYLPDLVGNVWYDWGLGPVTLPGAAAHPAGVAPHAPIWAVGALSVLGIFGRIALCGMVLLAAVASLRRRGRGPGVQRPAPTLGWGAAGVGWMGWAVVLGGCAYLLPLASKWFFDRYLIPLVGLGAVLLSLPLASGEAPPAQSPRWRMSRLAGLVMLGIMMAFSVAATHDYLAWNRARSDAYTWLREEMHVPRTEIEAGFEVNEWQRYNDPAIPDPDRQLLGPLDARHMVAAQPMPGYQVVRTFPHSAWLPTGGPAVQVLARIDHDTIP